MEMSNIAPNCDTAVNIGDRLELFVDKFLVDTMRGTELRLTTPMRAETVLKFDAAWEGRFSSYCRVIEHDSKLMLYYRGCSSDDADQYVCYAESGLCGEFERPELGLYKVNGSKKNNIILADVSHVVHNFTPFLDKKPGVDDASRFKAVGGMESTGLRAYYSEDGIHWKEYCAEPIIMDGIFDSQNVAFWSEHEGKYLCYFRTWVGHQPFGIRTISRAESDDFIHWSDTVPMSFGNTELEHLYTNCTQPYFRAPHIYVAMPLRFSPGKRVLSEYVAEAYDIHMLYREDCSDTVFMTSRGGSLYDRTFMESFIRPGLQYGEWASRSGIVALGITQLDSMYMSLYRSEFYAQPHNRLVRYMVEVDRFASVHAGYSRGIMLTKPFKFRGSYLTINFSTSAIGSILIEVDDEYGNPIPGYTADDAIELVGNSTQRAVMWKRGACVVPLQGRTIRLRFYMQDADLYALRFITS
jgi:hypothetical protein